MRELGKKFSIRNLLPLDFGRTGIYVPKRGYYSLIADFSSDKSESGSKT